MSVRVEFPVPGFIDLPVLRVTARSGEARRKWIDQLLHALELRSLSITCVRQKVSGHRNRHAVLSLVRLYDLVIIDSEIEYQAQQPGIGGTTEWVRDNPLLSGSDDKAMAQFVERLVGQMDAFVQQTPVWACILIGGKSSRMGRPKHLIQDVRKTTWLERTVEIVSPLVDGLVVSGTGRLPDKLVDTIRLADIPGVAGPLTGIVAAHRWQPMASWLLVACDMPHITTEAIQWLLSGRRAGCWARVPQLARSKGTEPLLAWYDFRAGQIFEEQLSAGNLRIGDAAAHRKVDTPLIPEVLRHSWKNINTPEQLPVSS